MKNGVECYKDFFPYFKALKTNCADENFISAVGTSMKGSCMEDDE